MGEWGFRVEKEKTRAFHFSFITLPMSVPSSPTNNHGPGQMLRVRTYEKGSRLATIQMAFEVFIRLDENRDGCIEFEQTLRGLHMFNAQHPLKFSQGDVKKLFGIADPNNSGYITFAEFYAMYACLSVIESKFGFNSDSVISFNEVRKIFKEAGLESDKLNQEEMFGTFVPMFGISGIVVVGLSS